jgi:hypothetical protein
LPAASPFIEIKMADCKTMIDMIRQGGDSAKYGMELLYNNKDLRKLAGYFHHRYRRYAETHDWEDLHTEAFVRVVSEIEEGRGPISSNCWGYFRNVCRNICEEFTREDDKNATLVQTLADLYKTPANDKIKEGVDCTLKKMGGKCESLLRFYYLNEPPVKDYEELSELLKEEGLGEFKSSAMHAHLYQCRQKFEQTMQNNPHCFNL